MRLFILMCYYDPDWLIFYQEFDKNILKTLASFQGAEKFITEEEKQVSYYFWKILTFDLNNKHTCPLYFIKFLKFVEVSSSQIWDTLLGPS